jgi:formylglycine-generating enzyme required for sulfatase activity
LSLTFGPLSTTRYVVNGVPFDTVRVPPGRCVDGGGWEKKRTLLSSRPFELGVTLVTQALWRAVMGSIPEATLSSFQGDDRPAGTVSWNDAQAFLGRLETLGFRGFRLPTEAEWAWAVQCGASTRWAGADRVKLVARVEQESTAPVGGLHPSAAGALDLSGNLWEWQEDWLDTPAAGVDVWGPASGHSRVSRGGSWRNFPPNARISERNNLDPGSRRMFLGLRLARTAP